MNFLKQLMAIHLLKLDLPSQIFPKLLTGFGMKVCVINSSLWVSQQNVITLKITCQEGSNGFFKWTNLIVETSDSRYSQGSIPLFFLIYINDSLNKLKSNAKLFAEGTSLFTIVKDKNESSNILNNDLLLHCELAYNWKMHFTQGPKKPAQEVTFSRKKQVQILLAISVSNISVERVSYQKHLRIVLGE